LRQPAVRRHCELRNAVAVHAFGSLGLPHFVRNEEKKTPDWPAFFRGEKLS